ncbi:aspartate carbamoyltransferase 1, chloroplastic-like [Aristolochia californica]|uniref:aspartate carbamoyltransferase 1, chloroplastic-like n=1 Tax=Aristolochia californica TaxID=171875 RepID=UPI0035DE6070
MGIRRQGPWKSEIGGYSANTSSALDDSGYYLPPEKEETPPALSDKFSPKLALGSPAGNQHQRLLGDAARRATSTTGFPVINVGDGPGQHPTLALLDVYTIGREIGKVDGIHVAVVGDLANGKTVYSLAYLLGKYHDAKFYFVAPDVVKMKDDIKEYLTSRGIEREESTNLREVVAKCDVVYTTCIHHERFGERIDLYKEASGKYIVDRTMLNVLQKHAVIDAARGVFNGLPAIDLI